MAITPWSAETIAANRAQEKNELELAKSQAAANMPKTWAEVLAATPGDYGGFYDWFYNSLLTTANSIPIQALWFVQFGEIPVNINVSNFENTKDKKEWNVNGIADLNWKKSGKKAIGMIFAQGVKIPGDGLNTSRLGPENSGMIKGIIGNGRRDIEPLDITFLETNYSFTEYNLRPWAIQVAHKSLKIRKDPAENLRTTITVTQLAKTGSKNSLKPRGIWTFYDACPVSIDTQGYDYGPDRVVQRQIQFAYNYYTFKPADTVDAERGPIDAIFESLRKQADIDDTIYRTPTVENAATSFSDNLDTPVWARVANNLSTVTSTKGLLDRAIETGIDILKGEGENIITNVKGTVTDAAESLIQRGQSALREAGRAVTTSITDVVKDAVDKIDLINPNDDTVVFDKTPILPGVEARKSLGPNIVETPADDTPRFNPERTAGSQYTANLSKRGEVKDVSGNRRNTGNANKTSKGAARDSADTPLFFKASDAGGGDKISQTDIPNTYNIPGQDKPVNTDDITHPRSLPTNINVINENDVSERPGAQIYNVPQNDIAGDQIPLQIVSIQNNDTAKRNQVPSQLVETNSNDIVVKSEISSQLVETNSNDTAIKSEIPSQLVETNSSDTVIKSEIPVQLVETNSSDTAIKSEIPVQLVETNSQDTAVKSEIPVQLVETNIQDTAVKSEIPVQLVEINRDDMANGKSIFTKEVTPTVNDIVNRGEIPVQDKKVPIDDTVVGIHKKIVEVNKSDVPVGSQIPLQIVSIKDNDTVEN